VFIPPMPRDTGAAVAWRLLPTRLRRPTLGMDSDSALMQNAMMSVTSCRRGVSVVSGVAAGISPLLDKTRQKRHVTF
jgi:hypothetical protein